MTNSRLLGAKRFSPPKTASFGATLHDLLLRQWASTVLPCCVVCTRATPFLLTPSISIRTLAMPPSDSGLPQSDQQPQEGQRFSDEFDPNQLPLPSPQLFTYYLLGAIASGPFVFLTLPALWFRYQTLKYRFEESGLRMHVGLLFKKETVTAYRRIQDIHLTSNVIQRWLGIASISIQTASGSAMPEIIIEGVTEPERLRDWLYERLRGTNPTTLADRRSLTSASINAFDGTQADEVQALLTEIRDNLATLAQRGRGEGS